VRLNFWDFGGQEIYYGLHSLFLQRQAVFLNLDPLLFRFRAGFHWSNSKEISAIRDALLTQLGGLWPFKANWSFLSGELARNELTAGLEKTGVFSGAKTVAAPWFRLECDLPTTSTIWQL
jgi:hypothetical protein